MAGALQKRLEVFDDALNYMHPTWVVQPFETSADVS